MIGNLLTLAPTVLCIFVLQVRVPYRGMIETSF
jgi:hypothetical protein